jgi:hypothetical protein
MVHVLIDSDGHGFDGTLVHELSHACLAHRNLPRWLDEAIAQRMALILTSRVAVIHYPPFPRDGKLFWQNHGIDSFLNGESFHREPESVYWSYALSEYLIEQICQLANGGEALRGFLLNARASDVGESAAQQYLGRSLESIVREMIKVETPSGDIKAPRKRLFSFLD